MSIFAFTGLPGSGKSYSVIENIVIPAIKENRVIYTNIPTNLEAIMQDYPDYNPDNFHFIETSEFSQELAEDGQSKAVHTFKSMPAGALVIVDEIGTIFPASMRINSCDQEFLECWSKHRHKVKGGRSQDIVIIAQNLRQVSKFIRDLVESTHIHFKLTALGSPSTFRRDIWSTGIDGYPAPRKTNPLFQKSELGKYKAKIFTYYQSHTLAEDGTAPKLKKFDFKSSIFNTWFFKIVFPVAIFVLGFCAWFVYDNVINQSDTLEDIQHHQEELKAQQESEEDPTTSKIITKESINTVSRPNEDNLLVPSSLRDIQLKNLQDEEERQQIRDYAYIGKVETADNQHEYAILQRENGKLIYINFKKYCVENKHKHIHCNYFGHDYSDTLS